MDRLLAAKANINAAALEAAARRGHLEVVDRLLTAKANVNATAGYYRPTALQAAVGRGHLE